MRELWDFVNEEISSLDSISAQTSDTVRFIADLAALGVDHLMVKHIARACSSLMAVVLKYDGESTIYQLKYMIGTVRNLNRLLDFMARQGLIEKEGDRVRIPENSVIRKVALPLRANPGGWFEERASLFLFGYMMLAAFNEFYKTNDVQSLIDLFGTSSDSITRPGSFMKALFFILIRWFDGFKRFSDSWLKSFLARRNVSQHLIEEIRNKLIGLDSKVSVSFIKAWQGRYDLFYVFDEYVLRVRERMRERMRARER